MSAAPPPPALLPVSAPLTCQTPGFSLLSWNVLLPNSSDGWWVYKYYHPDVPMEARTWRHRQSLIRAMLLETGPDIIALQETHGESFERDFAFLSEAGYDHVLHRKFRFRNATFWKRDRFELERPAKHKNKTLVTALRSLQTGHRLFLVNAHLTAGPASADRLRQVADGLDQARKDAKNLGLDPEQAAVIVCGDFNTPPGDTAVRKLLTTGSVDDTYREPGLPDVALTSSGKSHPFGALSDLHETLAWDNGRPPTMILPELTSRMRSEDGISTELRAALSALFDHFAKGAEALDTDATDAWLTAINGQPDRGTEHRAVVAWREQTDGAPLTREAFIGIYAQAVQDHKFWAVRHDLEACGVPFPQDGVFTDTYDYQFYSASALAPTAIRQALSDSAREEVMRGVALPNATFPSDHLPVTACYRWLG